MSSGVTVYLSPEAHAALREIAERTKRTIEEVLSDAVSLERLVSEAQAQGARVLVEKKGHVQELVPA